MAPDVPLSHIAVMQWFVIVCDKCKSHRPVYFAFNNIYDPFPGAPRAAFPTAKSEREILQERGYHNTSEDFYFLCNCGEVLHVRKHQALDGPRR
jgi:hypothetical protein